MRCGAVRLLRRGRSSLPSASSASFAFVLVGSARSPSRPPPHPRGLAEGAVGSGVLQLLPGRAGVSGTRGVGGGMVVVVVAGDAADVFGAGTSALGCSPAASL